MNEYVSQLENVWCVYTRGGLTHLVAGEQHLCLGRQRGHKNNQPSAASTPLRPSQTHTQQGMPIPCLAKHPS